MTRLQRLHHAQATASLSNPNPRPRPVLATAGSLCPLPCRGPARVPSVVPSPLATDPDAVRPFRLLAGGWFRSPAHPVLALGGAACGSHDDERQAQPRPRRTPSPHRFPSIAGGSRPAPSARASATAARSRSRSSASVGAPSARLRSTACLASRTRAALDLALPPRHQAVERVVGGVDELAARPSGSAALARSRARPSPRSIWA
jgi:hypothetical protein